MNYNVVINFQARSDEKARELFEMMLETFCNQPEGVRLDNSSLVKALEQR